MRGISAIAHYVKMRTAMPLKGHGGSVHHIHASTEYDAELMFSDLQDAVNSHEALKASLAEMVGVYWGEGDGIEPPPTCIQRALAVLASIEESV